MKTILSFIILLSISFTSCDKAILDIENPTASLSINKETFDAGETATFTISATDNDGLHDIDLDIYKADDLETSVKNFNVHSHGKTVNRTFDWVTEATDHTDYKAVLTVSDHSGNTASDTVNFHVMPVMIMKRR